MRYFVLLALLPLVACQPTPHPTPPQPSAKLRRPDPTAKALETLAATISAADPDQAIVLRVAPAGGRGAAEVTITDQWELQPEPTRQNSAQDLYITVVASLGVGGR